MTINEYQQLAMTTLSPTVSTNRDALINGVMGLCGESGEAIDISVQPSARDSLSTTAQAW